MAGEISRIRTRQLTVEKDEEMISVQFYCHSLLKTISALYELESEYLIDGELFVGHTFSIQSAKNLQHIWQKAQIAASNRRGRIRLCASSRGCGL